ncbi:PhnD/SsuA/transferrin family substrate-binding protein [Phenylobacterium sp.]|uniref:PhnD/SsuA/transferrin family substrate-binding protein n=1 Tax=Phenylobacterium sp. TaxID=1871053 RepID=UPI00286D7B15|nr:PhnD/SsuA/transferrin family substrate-binding protein [Phenylobacterium sp.]
MRKILLAVSAIVLIAAAAQTPDASLRIAAVSAKPGPCASLDATAAPGEKAYFDHLAKRLDVKVLKCPVADPAAAAAALAAGSLDMAVLDPASFAPVAGATRAILTIRPEGGLNRIPVVVAAPAAGPAKRLEDLRGKTLAFGGSTPAARALPSKVLADRGLGADVFKAELVAADAADALGKLRSGEADAIVLHAAAWQRLCMPDDPKAKPLCSDLKVLLKARPQAAQAIVVRKDIANEARYRLIGIHMPMHLENRTAFSWASSWAPKAAEFEPAEALALVAAR